MNSTKKPVKKSHQIELVIFSVMGLVLGSVGILKDNVGCLILALMWSAGMILIVIGRAKNERG